MLTTVKRGNYQEQKVSPSDSIASFEQKQDIPVSVLSFIILKCFKGLTCFLVFHQYKANIKGFYDQIPANQIPATNGKQIDQ